MGAENENDRKKLFRFSETCRTIALKYFDSLKTSKEEVNAQYRVMMEKNITKFYETLLQSLEAKLVRLFVYLFSLWVDNK